jgi:hypothetical protein
MIANAIASSTPSVWVLLPNPDAAEDLARRLMGADYVGRRVMLDGEPRLAVADALAFRHRLALPNHGKMSALQRMTLRGLLAISQEAILDG